MNSRVKNGRKKGVYLTSALISAVIINQKMELEADATVGSERTKNTYHQTGQKCPFKISEPAFAASTLRTTMNELFTQYRRTPNLLSLKQTNCSKFHDDGSS